MSVIDSSKPILVYLANGVQRSVSVAELRSDFRDPEACERQPTGGGRGAELRRERTDRGQGASVGTAFRDRAADDVSRQPPETLRAQEDR